MNETTIPEEEIREAWNATLRRKDDAQFWEYMIHRSGRELSLLAQQFRNGYLANAANAAKHAEEVRLLSARIAVLESDNRDARSSRDDYSKSLDGQRVANENLRAVIDSMTLQLTAAREREEKAVALIRDGLRAGDADDYERLIRDMREFLVRYDSIRAADGKEGA